MSVNGLRKQDCCERWRREEGSDEGQRTTANERWTVRASQVFGWSVADCESRADLC